MVRDSVPVAEVLHSLPCGILVIDHEDRVAYLNRNAAAMLLLRREEWIGSPVSELAAHLEREFACAGLQVGMQKAAGEPDVCSARDLALHRAKEVVYLREECAPLYDQSGMIIGRVFSYHDVSRQRKIDNMKTEFVGIASHELRTPMTSIKGAIDLVLSGFAGDINNESRELLVVAQENCERLVRLVNEILDLSKIEAGEMKLKLELLDPLVPIETAVRALRSFADQHGVQVVIESSETLPHIPLDKDRIQQVVTNLVSNAIKFSPDRGTVRVKVFEDKSWIECSVVDSGCGIAAEDLPRVFGKFQQLGHASRKGGTGLGLAIAKEIVKQHMGDIWVESKLGKGSRFTFRLPFDPGSNESHN